jgi:hypothetical protein
MHAAAVLTRFLAELRAGHQADGADNRFGKPACLRGHGSSAAPLCSFVVQQNLVFEKGET